MQLAKTPINPKLKFSAEESRLQMPPKPTNKGTKHQFNPSISHHIPRNMFVWSYLLTLLSKCRPEKNIRNESWIRQLAENL